MKTITIRDEVYRKLLSIKRENESFSDLFEMLAEGGDPRDTLRRLGAALSSPTRRECSQGSTTQG